MDDLKAKMEQARINAEQVEEASIAKINDLEGILQDKESEMREKVTLIFNKDAEIGRDKSQIEQLNQEVSNGHEAREQLEIDFKGVI